MSSKQQIKTEKEINKIFKYSGYGAPEIQTKNPYSTM